MVFPSDGFIEARAVEFTESCFHANSIMSVSKMPGAYAEEA